MAYRKRSNQTHKKPLRVLLKEIDAAADAYARNGYRNVIGENYLKTPPSLEELLEELESYHPLNLIVSWHGKKVLEKIHNEDDKTYASEMLEDEVRRAFEMRGRVIEKGTVKRDLIQIGRSAIEPFMLLPAAVSALRVIIKEMKKK